LDEAEKRILLRHDPRFIVYMNRQIRQHPFKSVYQILDYYQYNKRGRIKSVNLLEEEHFGSSNQGTDLTWETCCFAIERALKLCTNHQRKVFELRYCTEYPDYLTKGEIIAAIAKLFGKNKATIYRWLDEIIENIECEAVDIRLIPVKTWH
jgi:DNA-directed RNA polymerase specialized sigma24 family protein